MTGTPDFRFNDLEHLKNFLSYMFIGTKYQADRHENVSGYVYVNGKIYEYVSEQPSQTIKERSRVKNIFLNKEYDERYIPKATIIYSDDEEDLQELFTEVSSILNEFSKEQNIVHVCASSHYNQEKMQPHIHILYVSKEDIEDQILDFFARKVNGKSLKEETASPEPIPVKVVTPKPPTRQQKKKIPKQKTRVSSELPTHSSGEIITRTQWLQYISAGIGISLFISILLYLLMGMIAK